MPIPAAIWVGRALLASTAVKNLKVFRKVASKVGIDKYLGEASGEVLATVAAVGAMAVGPEKFVKLGAAGLGPLIEQLATLVTGLAVPSGTITGAVSGVANDESRLALGGIFSRLLDDTLKLETVKEGYLQRAPGHGERTNMERMVGAAFRMQLGDMMAEIAGKKLPFGIGSAFTEIAERIDKAINLDDAIEEIIQVPMEAVITRGMTEYYNRQLLPQDFTESEARQAFLQERISKEVLDKVLDNQGVRLDIRDHLLEMAAPNLTESDLDQAYQHNLLDRDEIKEQYKGKGFTPIDREIKTQLVEGTRRWKLEEKVFELYGNLYRDGVATKEEVRPFLEHYGYDPDEIDMWMHAQELERRQRKWISDANLIKLITRGEKTTTEAISYLTLQGMEVNDAAALITLAMKEEKEEKVKHVEAKVKAAVAKLPKAVKDKCDDLFSPDKILRQLLGEVIAMIPLGEIPLSNLVDLKTILECALENLGVLQPPTP